VPDQLTFATGNEGKLSEARAQLEPLGYEVAGYDGGYPEIQADTLEAVARAGLDHLVGDLAEPFMLEDAGLFVDGLDGFPGVYSSYVFATIGNEGLLALLAGREDRRARFRSVVGLREDGRNRTFVGEVEGRITERERGEGGFGFDPVFEPRVDDRTFAEMGEDEKIEISHRSRALQALAEHLDG
jgi:XTP/dITP diphosphohydrolase